MPKKRILVLTDQMPWGHRSIAKAIFGYLKTQEKEENIEVFYADVKAETGAGNDIYAFLCRYLPSAHRLVYKIAANKASAEVLVELSFGSLKGLKKEVLKYKPDLIISTYFLHSHCLAKWREDTDQKFKLWTVVADPWSIASVSFVPKADLHLVYDKLSVKIAIDYGISKEKIMQTGWWVRPEMYQEIDKKKARIKLGFTDDRSVAFIGGGSLGTSSLASILPAVMMVRHKIGLVINTGTDKFAYNMVEEYIKLFKRLRKNDLVVIKNMGWIENMAEVLAGCDMVFGKAGPNFLFDTMACKKPFVAITHIGGQEDGNIDLIKKKQIGWVKEKGNLPAKFFLEYTENPKKYEEKFMVNILQERQKNSKSMPLIMEKIRRILT